MAATTTITTTTTTWIRVIPLLSLEKLSFTFIGEDEAMKYMGISETSCNKILIFAGKRYRFLTDLAHP